MREGWERGEWRKEEGADEISLSRRTFLVLATNRLETYQRSLLQACSSWKSVRIHGIYFT